MAFIPQPDFVSIKDETGTATYQAVNNLWRAVNHLTQLIAPVTQGGSVNGPGSPTTAHAIARWHDSTGKTLDNSTALLGDDGSLDVNGLYRSPLKDDGNSGTAKTIDWSAGNDHFLTLTGNVTLTLNNPKDGVRLSIVFATGTGGFTVTWPASVLWSGGTAPVITATASKYDLVALHYIASIGKYIGAYIQNFG